MVRAKAPGRDERRARAADSAVPKAAKTAPAMAEAAAIFSTMGRCSASSRSGENGSPMAVSAQSSNAAVSAAKRITAARAWRLSGAPLSAA